MFRSGGTEKAQPPFLMERLLSKLLNLNFYFMKKEKEKLFRVLPLAVGLLLVGGNAMAVPVSAPVEYSVNQQTSQVTGVVNDANGDPLIGVNVVEKGNTHNGAITDMDGKFVLNVSPNATLVFSYIGYKPVEVPVNGQRNITVTLHEDSEALDEVVVIGYGAVRKADLAGSVAVMDNKQFKDQPVTRIYRRCVAGSCVWYFGNFEWCAGR